MNYKTEHNIQSLIMLKLSELGYVPLRANAGQFWQGKTATINGQLILTNIKSIKGMPEGTSDIICIMPNGKTAYIEIITDTSNKQGFDIKISMSEGETNKRIQGKTIYIKVAKSGIRKNKLKNFLWH